MGTITEGRILALDVGEKRIGMAVSDPTGIFAVGIDTLMLRPKTDVLAEVEQVCRDYQVYKLVVGLPMSLKGIEGRQADLVRAFAQSLQERLQLPLEFFDERFTSVLAHQTLKAQGIAPSRNRELVDQAAAKRILQDYLDREGYRASQP